MKERTDRLRELLRTATDFLDPWGYFHDELAMNAAFMKLGHAESSRKLEAVLGAIGGKLLGRKLAPSSPLLIHVKPLSFWHGHCGLGDRMAIFFYFEDTDQGLVGLMKDIESSEVLLARMSLVEMPPGVAGMGKGGKA